MKRSEMLDKIAFVISCSPAYSAPVSHYLDEHKMALEVLNAIEHLGMVPPIIKEKSFTMIDGVMTYAVHEWEKE